MSTLDDVIKPYRSVTVLPVVAACEQNSLFVTEDVMRDAQQDIATQMSHEVLVARALVSVDIGWCRYQKYRDIIQQMFSQKWTLLIIGVLKT